MTEKRYTELIHGEIDGTNSPSETTELGDFLAEDTQARQFHGEMIQLQQVLGQVEEVAPPGGLRGSILAAIDAGDSASPVPIPFRKSPTVKGVATLRYVAVMAAGLVLGMVLGSNTWSVPVAEVGETQRRPEARGAEGGLADGPQ